MKIDEAPIEESSRYAGRACEESRLTKHPRGVPEAGSLMLVLTFRERRKPRQKCRR
jgi:hypothetical protein